MKKRRLSEINSDFSIYMNTWQFKQRKTFIPIICEDKLLKEMDDWLKFKNWLTFLLIRKGINSLYIVFFYLMKAFVHSQNRYYNKLFVFLVFSEFIYDSSFI